MWLFLCGHGWQLLAYHLLMFIDTALPLQSSANMECQAPAQSGMTRSSLHLKRSDGRPLAAHICLHSFLPAHHSRASPCPARLAALAALHERRVVERMVPEDDPRYRRYEACLMLTSAASMRDAVKGCHAAGWTCRTCMPGGRGVHSRRMWRAASQASTLRRRRCRWRPRTMRWCRTPPCRCPSRPL